jgi:hypothetical protein
LIRYLAMSRLYAAARGGSERAKGAVLDAARSPDREVKITAIQYSYALSRQRWKARRALETRLADADLHLLDRY